MALNTTFVAGAILTAAQTNNLPFGVVGYQNYTGGNFTATTSQTAVTGISIAFTGVAGRIYKATFTAQFQSVTSAHRTTARVYQGLTGLTEGVSYAGADDYNELMVIAIFEATGATTMTVQATANAHTSVLLGAAAPNNMVFIIEDIGKN